MTLIHRIYNAVVRRFRHMRFLLAARKNSINNLGRVRGGNVLVLCYGNIYRSPFVANRLASLLDESKWTIRSAGFYNKTDRPCADDFIILSKKLGVDLSKHRSRQVSEVDLQWADLIVIMDVKNRELLRNFGATAEMKAIWIGAWLTKSRVEVIDPYGKSAGEVEQITQRLSMAADTLAAQLARLNF